MSKIYFVCDEQNDLYKLLKQEALACRAASLAEAVEEAPVGAAILSLAADYPTPKEEVGADLLEEVTAKNLRLYIEYPSMVAGVELGEPRSIRWERGVVSSDFFAPAVLKSAIIVPHGCWFTPVKAENPHLVAARVAGYKQAHLGIPEEAWPLLFQLPGSDVLVATTSLSQFVTARFGPQQVWGKIWEGILRWLLPGEQAPSVSFESVVTTQAGKDEKLPEGIEADAFRRSVKWFREQALFSIDEKKGVIEGFESAVDHRGQQRRRTWNRADCIAESGLVFALDWALTRNPESKQTATQILDYVWSKDFLQLDPENPAYGLVNWYERGPIFYGDDNARVILPTLAAARLLGSDKWNKPVSMCLLANLRTTGKLGFRRDRIDQKHFGADGWQQFYEEETVHYAPHFQAYLWACYLWAYGLTGYEGFLHKTKTAIRMTMETYPRWRWTNGLIQEIARMILPLAYLVRLEDTPEHRAWLKQISDDLLAQMQSSGAIQEKMGPRETGRYPSPASNEDYGKREASVIQENGDPACDLLYTVNYAFLGLHEAAHSTGDEQLRAAEDRLAEFLCRIQVRSKVHANLDGAWMRSFDYEMWEYWGSSADLGWGAWCVESGWTNTWIASILGLRQLGTSLYGLTTADEMKSTLSPLVKEFGLV